MNNNDSYSKKFIQMDKEAAATAILSVIIFALFWLAIFIFKDSDATILMMPSWFVISCIGGYVLSVVGVIILVRFFMKNFNLDDEDKDEQ